MAFETIVGSMASMVSISTKYFILDLIIPLYDYVTIGYGTTCIKVGGETKEDVLKTKSMGKVWFVATNDWLGDWVD